MTLEYPRDIRMYPSNCPGTTSSHSHSSQAVLGDLWNLYHPLFHQLQDPPVAMGNISITQVVIPISTLQLLTGSPLRPGPPRSPLSPFVPGGPCVWNGFVGSNTQSRL